MKIVPRLAFAGLVLAATRVHAELPDCATFPNGARFTCYDAISRAPKPEPRPAVKTDTGKPRPAVARSSKSRTD
jgi:hypothetical protein